MPPGYMKDTRHEATRKVRPMKALEALVEFCQDVSYESLPSPVVERAKLLATNTFANLVAGRSSESGGALSSFVIAQGGQPDATLVGYQTRLPAGSVVLANSAMAHSLEMDDTHNESVTHTGAAIVPSVLAAAEREGAVSGKDLLVATVIGVEVMARVGMALHPASLYANGYHPSSLCAPFGVAAAVGRVLRLKPEQMASAFSLAAIQSAGLLCASEKGFSWHFQYGRGAQSGVYAAYLVKEGAEGPTDIFEGKGGLASIYSPQADMSKLSAGLGQPYAVQALSFKMHASLQFGQASIDALLTVLKGQQLHHTAIDTIRLRLPSAFFDIVGAGSYPMSKVAAQSNPRYLMAVAAMAGKVMPDQFSPDFLNDDRIRELFERVEVRADKALDAIFPARWPAAVEVVTKGGETYHCEVRNARGDADNPPTRDEIEGKFMALIEGRLSQPKAQALMAQLRHLDSVDDASGLAESLGDVTAYKEVQS